MLRPHATGTSASSSGFSPPPPRQARPPRRSYAPRFRHSTLCRSSAKRRHGAQPNRPDGTRVVFGAATCLLPLLRNHELGEQRVERYRSERWVLETRAGSIDGVGAAGRDALGQQLDVGLKLRDAV
jgi:hypothetical protein